MRLVSEGLVVNGCVPTQVMTMKVQKPDIFPSVILTIPVDAAPNATLPVE